MSYNQTISAWMVGALLVVSAAQVSAQGLPVPGKDAPAPPAEAPPQKQKGWLGIGLKPIPAEEAKARGYDHTLVRVDAIFGGSPAEASGFLVDDVILEVDGERIKESAQLVNNIGARAAGDKVQVRLLRGKELIDVPLLLGLHPGKYGLLKSRFLNQPAPEFSVKQVKDDKALTLAGLRGEVVIVDFWATWCGPCKRAIPQLEALQAEFKGQGLTVVGISDEEKATLTKFTAKSPIKYTVAYDADRGVNRAYMVSALPTLFVIDHEGVVRDIHIGAGQMEELKVMVKGLLDERKKSKKNK
jgi:peroxiredoxin